MKHIITLLLLFYCAASFAQKTVNKTFSNIKNIRINTASGGVTLKKGNGQDLKLTLNYTYDDDEFTPIIEENAGKLTIKEEFSRGSHSGNSSWSLEIPNDISISVNTGSGDLTVDQLKANIKSNLGSGDIDITSVTGELDFNTGSGNIELNKVDGEVSMNTGSGDIRIESGSGLFSLNAGSGDIKLNQSKGEFSVNTGSGKINAKALALTGSSRFNTGSGDVNVTLGAKLDYNISLNSGSGDAVLNFNGNPIEGEVIMTANKRNGSIVAPFKFDKEETIDDDDSSQERVRKTAKLGNKNITIKVGTGSGTAEISK